MSTDRRIASPPPSLSVGAVCIAAAAALAVAMGIGRFAFTPMLPLMVRDGSLATEAGSWLAASNYLGYLAGALTVAWLGLSPSAMMCLSIAGIVVTTAAMGLVDGMAAWMVLRCVAGAFSAWGLVSVSAWALPHLVHARRADLSGLVYAGVGLGIAFAGLFCLVAAQPGVPARWLWLGLGALAALAGAVSIAVVRRARPLPMQVVSAPDGASPRDCLGLVICYGAFGFGYILPATFLPALAREVWDDPRVFGLAWPVFGFAAAASTIAVARWSKRVNRLRVWAVCHVVMALGVVLPSLWLTPAVILAAALAVGSTFVVVTMVGLQEARARSPGNPTRLLAAITASFALGQLAGPLVSGGIDLLSVGSHAALRYALQLGAAVLAASAVYLWRQSRRETAD